MAILNNISCVVFFSTVFFLKSVILKTQAFHCFFKTVFPDCHCAKLAIKYLIHGIEN